jgi:hypothetical protein
LVAGAAAGCRRSGGGQAGSGRPPSRAPGGLGRIVLPGVAQTPRDYERVMVIARQRYQRRVAFHGVDGAIGSAVGGAGGQKPEW